MSSPSNIAREENGVYMDPLAGWIAPPARPDEQAREEVQAHLNRVALDTLATADMAPDLALANRRLRVESEEWEGLYVIAVRRMQELRDDLRDACSERDNWKQSAYEEATSRGSVEASLFAAEHRATEERREADRQTQLAQDRLHEIGMGEATLDAVIDERESYRQRFFDGARAQRQKGEINDFLTAALKSYASHAWNDIKREITRRWP